MKLVRSWPAEIPEGRAYVVDDIPKFIMGNEGERQFDYRGLVDLDDDVVLIEWDIAVGGEQLALFMERAKAEPDRPVLRSPNPHQGNPAMGVTGRHALSDVRVRVGVSATSVDRPVRCPDGPQESFRRHRVL
jgi:hypothetical protein